MIVCETVANTLPQSGEITNAEVASAFGADLILLNGFDCYRPAVLDYQM